MIAVSLAVDRLTAALGGGAAARLAAGALVEADAIGQTRFGIALLEEWAAEAAAPVRGDPGALSWRDCSNSFAPLAVATATLDLARIAPAQGIAAAFLRGVKGFGRLAPFVRHIADQGLVGIAGAEGPPFVAPLGGNRPVIGTNPLAFALGQGESQVVIDVASSGATMADIRSARDEGRPLKEGIAIDAEGKPTRIAAEVAALLPRGGQIGSLVGLVVELLAGVAGGGRGDAGGRGAVLIAIDPAAAKGFDWRDKLAVLRADWTTGGGHWPGAARPMPDTLDDGFARRLEAHLARMAAGRG